MTADYRNETLTAFQDYVKLFYTDYITWKLIMYQEEKSVLVTSLVEEAEALRANDAAIA